MDYFPPPNDESGDPNAPYVNAVPGVTEGSSVHAKAVEGTMREILSVIDAAGIERDEEDFTQLLQALSALTNNAGGLIDIQIFKESGTWLMPDGLDANSFLIVQGVGGGGGGAGVSSSGNALGGGGAAGGYFWKKIPYDQLDVTEPVVIGAGGAGGPAGTNIGQQGNTTSFGSHCSATGGLGGHTNTSVTSPIEGGIGIGGDINTRGGPGSGSAANTSDSGAAVGQGGNSHYGGGGSPSTGADGTSGDTGGGGAGGMRSGGGSPARAGGKGGDGLIIACTYR